MEEEEEDEVVVVVEEDRGKEALREVWGSVCVCVCVCVCVVWEKGIFRGQFIAHIL